MADPYSVTIEGLDELLKRLDILRPLKDGMKAASIYFVKIMKVYPPKPPKSTYQRTMALRNRWTYYVSENAEMSVIGNNTPYAPYVQGRDDQTWFHKRTGWGVAEDTLDVEKDNITEYIAIPIRDYLNGKA